ncbi:PAS domain-containing sensor histidine kinase [Kiloniella antarctica]|uniref:histidine kinase n=1 Tax=Kiloniella antarctica TaxID=1550907 RepID=A0ABW5BSY7_9PROT
MIIEQSNECALTSDVRSNVSALFLENSIEAVLVTDALGSIVYANPAVSQNFGFTVYDLIGRTIFDFIKVSSEEQKSLLMLGAADGNAVPCEGVVETVTGVLLDVLLRSFRLNDKGDMHRAFFVRDISARVSIRKELKSSQQLMGSIVEGVSDAILATNQTGDLTLFNKGAESVFGYRAEEIIGKDISILVPNDLELNHIKQLIGIRDNDFYTRNIEMNGGMTGEISGQRKNGEIFPAEATIMQINDGEELSFAAVIRDISERIKVQDELQEAKEMAEIANQMKSSFLANMSHELRTPLNAIIGFSEFITGEHLGRLEHKKYREYVGDILNSGRHLLTIVNDILDLSRVEAGEVKLNESVVCIRQSILSAYRFVTRQAKGKNISLNVNLDDDLSYLFADERILKQIIINLVTNAVKFTPEGGSIKATINTFREDGRLSLIITDTGIGIAEEDLERVIKPFEQSESSYTKTIEGTGLGLSLAQSLMELHGGDLNITSELGVGTSVELTFPSYRVVPSDNMFGQSGKKLSA